MSQVIWLIFLLCLLYLTFLHHQQSRQIFFNLSLSCQKSGWYLQKKCRIVYIEMIQREKCQDLPKRHWEANFCLALGQNCKVSFFCVGVAKQSLFKHLINVLLFWQRIIESWAWLALSSAMNEHFFLLLCLALCINEDSIVECWHPCNFFNSFLRRNTNLEFAC